MPRTSPYVIVLDAKEKAELERRARKYTSLYRDVVRARVVLLAAAGLDNDEIGARVDMPRQVVSKWRKRFCQERLAGLEDRVRCGRPRTFSPSDRGCDVTVHTPVTNPGVLQTNTNMVHP